jgi:hypothetical protein
MRTFCQGYMTGHNLSEYFNMFFNALFRQRYLFLKNPAYGRNSIFLWNLRNNLCRSTKSENFNPEPAPNRIPFLPEQKKGPKMGPFLLEPI